MKTLKCLICLILIFIGFNSCDQLNQSTPDENIDWSEGDYAYIDLENFPGWETGIITKNDNYLLVKLDTSNNGYIGYINSRVFESDGIAFYYDENLEIQSFATSKGACYINRINEEQASIILITKEESTILENIVIPKYPKNQSIDQTIETRAFPSVSNLKRIAEGISIFEDIKGQVKIIQQLLTGDWDNASLNFLQILAGQTIKDPFKGLKLDARLTFIEEGKKAFDQMGQIIFLGDCQIHIGKTKISTKKFKLDVTITGFESLPIMDFQSGKKSIVLGGIAINKYEHMTYSSNERIIHTWVIDGNGSKTLEFELPEDVTYYAMPYLLPTDGQNRFTTFIKYGNSIALPYFNGVIDEFKQISYTENNDTYTFKCYAHASCNTKEDEYWKLYYENDLGWKEFYSAKTYNEPSISATNNGEFEFDIELHASKFKDVNTKNIKLGIAKFDKNHYLLIASEPQIFELNVTRKRLKRYNTHNVLYYDEKGRIVKKVDTRYNYVVEIIYNDTNNSASIYEDGEYSGIAEISNGFVRSICGETISYDSNNYFIKSRNCSQTWSNGNITRSSKNISGHTEYSNFTYGDKLNKLNFDVWTSYNCYFPTYYVYFTNKNITTHLPISCDYTYGNATYTYEFDNDGYVTKAIEHFTLSDGDSGTETFTFEYETY